MAGSPVDPGTVAIQRRILAEERSQRVDNRPYGRAMDNQSFFVLDAALNPCPVGVVGDLYIGGIGLAREYWRDTQKTNASFLVHPTRGERIYCTGDIGR